MISKSDLVFDEYIKCQEKYVETLREIRDIIQTVMISEYMGENERTAMKNNIEKLEWYNKLTKEKWEEYKEVRKTESDLE